jgi:hypothetical protein
MCCASGCATTSSDPQNCGSCGNACAPQNVDAARCAGGSCDYDVCLPGFGDCDGVRSNGCEASLSDPSTCGSCTNACAAGATCVSGSCQSACDGHEGAFAPVVSPTYLPAGFHTFTTVDVPAGAVVYVTGGGAASATLDICATGHIQIDGTIDLSGGAGTESIIASTSTQQGRAGTGGITGTPMSAMQPTFSCAFIGGVSGSNGPAVSGTTGTCMPLSGATCDGSMPTIFASTSATYGGGAGVFTGYRAYGAGGGGYGGGAPGALGVAFPGQTDCSGASAGGGAVMGTGGLGGAFYGGGSGRLGQTQCAGMGGGVPAAYVGGGGGGSIGAAAASDLAVLSTFYAGSGGGGGSADYEGRPAFGGTSGGGGGGGALRLSTTADIVITGSLLANGGSGGDAYIGTPAGAGCDPQPGAAGGGGSGGLIYLSAPAITVAPGATVSAVGGSGGAPSVFASGGGGGGGGAGRIRLSVTAATCSLGGTFTPPLLAGCAPTTPAAPAHTYVGDYPN